jgi:metal-sulfur cluster biosynthetic enzyme
MSAVSEKDVLDALRGVMDPELGINIVDLGLIYEVKVHGKKVNVKMTFTTPACPLLQYIVSDVEERVGKTKGVEEVVVQLTWDPPWNPDKISAEGKKQLGLE